MAADNLTVREPYIGASMFYVYDGNRIVERAGRHFDSTAALAALDAERLERKKASDLVEAVLSPTPTADETYIPRAACDALRRVRDAIRELDRADAGLGGSVPGHSFRDAAHGLRVLADEIRDYNEVEVKQDGR